MPTAILRRPIENTDEPLDLLSLVGAYISDADDEGDAVEGDAVDDASLPPFHCDGTRRDPLQEIIDTHFEEEELRVSKYLIDMN